MRIKLESPGDLRHTIIGDLPIADVEIVRHSTGKIFFRYLIDNLIDHLAEDMRRNIRDKYDNFVVIDGPEGSGKSNLAWAICKRYCPEFNLDENYLYGMSNFKDRISNGTDRGHTYWLDEISNIANKRDWAATDNKNFIELLEMCRSREWSIISCIPRFDRLDQYIREHRARYWIHCEPMRFDKYGYKDRGYFELRKRDKFGIFRLIGYGTYDPMPPEISKEYESIKLNSQNTKIQEVVNGPDKPGAKYKTLYEQERHHLQDSMLRLKATGKFNDFEIMEIFGVEKKRAFQHMIHAAKERNGYED